MTDSEKILYGIDTELKVRVSTKMPSDAELNEYFERQEEFERLNQIKG